MSDNTLGLMTSRSYAEPMAESTARVHRGRERAGEWAPSRRRRGPVRAARWRVLLVVMAACGGATPAPEQPSRATQELLARADAAEKDRRYDRAQRLYLRARQQAPDAASGAAAALAHG